MNIFTLMRSIFLLLQLDLYDTLTRNIYIYLHFGYNIYNVHLPVDNIILSINHKATMEF